MCRAGQGFTQDLSARGVFFFTDAPLEVGAEIELTLRMPSEITLGENMAVRCRGRVLRVVRPPALAENLSARGWAETKIGAAVRFDGYEYLTEAAEASVRVSALHPQHEEETPNSSVRTSLRA